MSIWFSSALTSSSAPAEIEKLQQLGKDTLAAHIGIEFVDIGENFLKARMPVDNRTRQPFGLLHGGASAVLAETLGSVASAFVVDLTRFYPVGLEINANHIRGVKDGWVYATATPLHLGSTTHVWDIKIHNEQEKLVCVSRLTVAILKR